MVGFAFWMVSSVRMKQPIAILGAGNVATALAVILARHDRPIHLYCIEEDVLTEINRKHRNTKYLRDVKLPHNIRAFGNVAEAVHRADIVIAAVPSFALKEVLLLALPFFDTKVVIGSITKGLDDTCLQPLAMTIKRSLPNRMAKRLCVIGGPAIATDLAHRHPAALVIAGEDEKATTKLARLLRDDMIKVATSRDMIGVGYCMALKNIYAIPLGMCDGLKYPMNTKAMVLSIAIDEMERLLEAAGADPKTAAGLAGVGDLLVTGFSPHGRNRAYGERLVGSAVKDPRSLGLQTVEGIAATRTGRKLARNLKVKTPLLDVVAKCLSAEHHFERPFIEYLKHLTLH